MKWDTPTILEKVEQSFRDVEPGTEWTTEEIIDRVVEHYPGTNRRSILPSDYCYNLTNKGKENNPALARFKLFEQKSFGKYLYRGPGYQYGGPINRHPRL